MRHRLIRFAGFVPFVLLASAAVGQTAGVVPLAKPHYGVSEGATGPSGTSVVPFRAGPASTVPPAKPLPSVGSPTYFGVPRILQRRH